MRIQAGWNSNSPDEAGSAPAFLLGYSRPRREEIAFDVALAATVAFFGIIPTGAPAGPLMLVPALILAVAIGVRRLWPRVMIGCAIASGVLQLLTDTVAPFADLGYVVLFFTLGSSPQINYRRLGLFCAVVAAIGMGIYFGGVDVGTMRFTGTPFRPLTAIMVTAACAFLTVGGWMAGMIRWRRQEAIGTQIQRRIDAEENRRLSERVEQSNERNRIAADMHDVVAHSLAVVAAQADGARYALQTYPQRAEQALEVIADTARTAIGDLRQLLVQLRTGEDGGYTPGTSVDDLVTLMRTSGMDLRFEEYGTRDPSSLAAVASHRILGEALTNALKHGDLSAPVRCTQDWRSGYHLEVRNRIFSDPTEALSSVGTGHGLIGMRERIEVAGGTLTARPEEAEFVVQAHIPSVR